MSGFVAWLMWLMVHLFALTGFKNRLAVLFNWTIAFLGRGRAQRAITAQQVFARQALETQTTVIGAPVASPPTSELATASPPQRRTTT